MCARLRFLMIIGLLVCSGLAQAATLSGRVFNAQNQGLGGITITLLDANGAQLQTDTTNSTGAYNFSVSTGLYIIRPPQPAQGVTYYPFDGTKSERQIEIVNAAQNATAVDFTTDQNIPSVKLLFPRTGDKLKGDFGLFGTAFKPVNCSGCPDIEHVELRVDGQAVFVAKLNTATDRLSLSQMVWGDKTTDQFVLNAKWEKFTAGSYTVQVAARNTNGKWGLSNAVRISIANTSATAFFAYPDGFSSPALASNKSVTLTGKVEGATVKSEAWYKFEVVKDTSDPAELSQEIEYDARASGANTLSRDFPIEGVYPIAYTAVDNNNNTLVSIKNVLIYRPAYKGDLNASRSGSREVGFGVNAVSGNFYYQTSDLSLPGVGVPFEFSRRYSALSFPGEPQENGIMGKGGWGHSYQYAVFLSPSGRQLYLSLPDGHWERFALTDKGWESMVPGSTFVIGPEFNSATNKIKSFLASDGSAKYYFDKVGEGQRRTWYLGKIEDQNGNKQTLNYTGNLLTSIVDAQSRTITFNYTGVLLTSIDDGTGRSVSYAYDSEGFLTSYKDRMGNTWQYSYAQHGDDGKKYLTSATDPESRVLFNNVYEKFSASGAWSSGEYRVTAQRTDEKETSAVYNWFFDYQTDRTLVTNPVGDVVTYTLNESRMVSQVDYPGGGSLKHDYRMNAANANDKSQPTKVTSPEGRSTTVEYGDSKLGNPQAITDAAGNKTELVWEEDPDKNISNLLVAKLPGGLEYKLEYDTHHNPTKITDPLNRASTFTYNPIPGQLFTRTDSMGQTVTLTYYDDTAGMNKKGRVKTIKDAAGNSEMIDYDDKGRVASKINKRDYKTEYLYNNDDQVISVVRHRANDNEPVIYVKIDYDLAGNRISVEQRPRNLVTQYEYNSLGLLKSKTIKDRRGNVLMDGDKAHVTLYFYDPLQRLSRVVNPSQSEVSSTFTKNGEVAKSVAADGHYIHYAAYDKDGNLKRAEYRTANGTLEGAVDYEYDTLNRVSKKTVVSTGTETLVTEYRYNEQGKLAWSRNPRGKETWYMYDPVERLIEVQQSGISAKTEYDESKTIWQRGLRIVVTPPAPKVGASQITLTDPLEYRTVYHYDEAGQLAEKAMPDGTLWKYTYDQNGNLLSYTNGKGEVTTYQYDDLDRLINVKYPVPNAMELKYAYDDVNNVITISEGSANIVRQEYDILNRMKKRTDAFGNAVSYGYDVENHITDIVYPGDKTVQYHYEKGRMASLQDWLGNVTLYGYDGIGRLETVTHSNQTLVKVDYDQAGRVLEYANRNSNGDPIADYAFTLDGNGNRVKATVNQPLLPDTDKLGEYCFYNGANQMLRSNTGATSEQYGFDPDGRLTGIRGDTIATLDYDTRHRLISWRGDAGNYRYRYSPTGERVASVENDQETHFVVDTNAKLPNVLMRTDASGKARDYFVYGASGLVSQITADGKTLTYHFDPSGNTVAQTSADQAVVNKYAYLPYGEHGKKTEAVDNPFEFVGQFGVMAEANGLNYMRARFYSPDMRRFLSRDPVWGGGMSTIMCRGIR